MKLSDMVPPYTYQPVRREKQIFYRIVAGNGLMLGALSDEGAAQLIIHALNFTYSDKHETTITTRTFKTKERIPNVEEKKMGLQERSSSDSRESATSGVDRVPERIS